MSTEPVIVGVDDHHAEPGSGVVLKEGAREGAGERELSARNNGASVHRGAAGASLAADPSQEADVFRASEPRAARQPAVDPDLLPWWYRVGLVVALSVVLAVSVAGTGLAMVGEFRPALLVIVAAPIVLVLVRAWRPLLRAPDDPIGPRYAAVALAIVVVFVSFAARQSTQHVIVDRDPGVYVNTGLWLARHGDLYVATDSAAFGQPTPAHVRFDTPGFYSGAPGNRLYPQFLHVLPVLIATGDLIGGRGFALRVPAIVSGLALLAIYAFATRFLRPPLALGVLLLTAVNMTTVVFARDAYTEPLTQLLLFAALWTLWPSKRALSPGHGTAIGLLLGVCVMTRIDAVVYLIPLVGWAFLELRRDRSARRWMGPAAMAAAVPLSLAFMDATVYSKPYASDLGPSVVPLLIAFGVVVAVGAVLAERPTLFSRAQARFHARRQKIAMVSAWVVAAIAFLAWVVRPLISTTRAARASSYANNLEVLQRAEGVAIDGSRTYAEDSVRWLGWYLGPTVIVLGFVGLAYLVWRLVRGERREMAPFIALFAVVTALYAWRPSIDPNQLWAMRRFFPVTIPGLLLLAGVAVELVGRWLARLEFSWRDRRRIAVALAVCLGGPALIIPLRELRPVFLERELVPLRAAMDVVCGELPDHALVFIPEPGLFADRIAPPLRTVCGASVAIGDARPADSTVATTLNDTARKQGRPFLVVSNHADPFNASTTSVPESQLAVSVTYHRLELSVESVPNDLWDEDFEVWVARWS
ncbi:MAG: hypothetical protein QOC92_3216 [Acidimicrobiaceae bacterium]